MTAMAVNAEPTRLSPPAAPRTPGGRARVRRRAVTSSIVPTDGQSTLDQSAPNIRPGLPPPSARPTIASTTTAAAATAATTCQSGRRAAVPSAAASGAKTPRRLVRYSGCRRWRNETPRPVIKPSTIEAPNTWAANIAGIASDRPYGLYRAWPFCEKSAGSMPSSIPTARAETVMPAYAPIPAATARRVESTGDPAASSRYVA